MTAHTLPSNTLTDRLRRDERGISFVIVGLGFLGFFSATILAIDVGMLMTARSQAQNAADAGALAGAVALLYDDFNNRSSSGPAVQSAMSTATENQVINAPIAISPADVTFPNDPQGRPNWVRVQVFRDAAHGNPLSTLVASYFGMPTASVNATATAEAAPSNAETCVKPFTIPDKWIEKQTAPWDPDDSYEAFDNKGNPLANPDIYIPAGDPAYTGYNSERDRGIELRLKAGQGNQITPSFYFALAVPDDEGGADYRWNIANCNTTVMYFDELMTAEPGNMVGPTAEGIQALIDKDPGAYWDTTNNRPVSTVYPSPRVVVIPVYDPVYYDTGKRNGRNADLKAANFIGFFIEGMQGNDVVGRITPVSGLLDGGGGPAPNGAFPLTIRLVQ